MSPGFAATSKYFPDIIDGSVTSPIFLQHFQHTSQIDWHPHLFATEQDKCKRDPLQIWLQVPSPSLLTYIWPHWNRKAKITQHIAYQICHKNHEAMDSLLREKTAYDDTRDGFRIVLISPMKILILNANGIQRSWKKFVGPSNCNVEDVATVLPTLQSITQSMADRHSSL